jgi:hypothetical protein
MIMWYLEVASILEKGQLLFLESANTVVENESFQEHDKKKQNSSQVTLARRYHIRKLLPMLKDSNSISRFVSSLNAQIGLWNRRTISI